jgi:hypothetical protein
LSLEAKGEFREAARDYRLLLDRGYSGQATLKLVGDRHRLQAEERLILFRGIASAADSELRRAKLRKEAEGGLLLLDAYNQAFGIVHYLLGKPCFIATDGLLRDAGANYGRVPHDELLLRAFAELALGAARCGVARVEAFLDAPVSRSAEHAQSLEAAFESAGLEATVSLGKSADGAIAARLGGLLGEPSCAALVASGDSALVDRAPAVFDLARRVLEERFGAALLDLAECLGGDSGSRRD